MSYSTKIPENPLKRAHYTGPLSNKIRNIKKQYKRIELKSFSIDCGTSRNNCILLKNGRVASIVNIVECKDNNIFLIGKEISTTGDLYEEPSNSSLLNIRLVLKGAINLSIWR